ncbi:GNAT family N-acetyltransferase [Roseibium algae]|uniref:GNAT family N-acetyltransferase n=1 Tax=Roseibium algae TaxID=3123038 RepID=A0ABU8TPQ4_9HYPH
MTIRLEQLRDLAAAKEFVRSLGPCPIDLPYHTTAWLEAWQSNLGDLEGCKPVLLAGLGSAGPACFLPLGLEQRGSLKVLSFLGHNRGNQATGIWATGSVKHVETSALRDQLAEIARDLGADLIQLANMPSEIDGIANPLLADKLVPSPSPVFVGKLNIDFDVLYRETHSKASRKKLTKKQITLEASGEYQITAAKTPEQIARGLEAFLAQRAVRAAATGIPNVFVGPQEKTFLQNLLSAEGNDSMPSLKLWWLECAGSIRATYLCSRTQDTLIGYANSISHDDMTPHSPGVVLLKEIICRACADPTLKKLDLGLGDERYKRSWTAPCPLVDSNRALSLKGALALHVFTVKQTLKAHIRDSEKLWPLVKKMRALRARLG